MGAPRATELPKDHRATRKNREGQRLAVIAKGYETFGQTYDLNEEERTIEIKLNDPHTTPKTLGSIQPQSPEARKVTIQREPFATPFDGQRG